MVRKNGMGDLVTKNIFEDAFEGSFQPHVLTEHLAAVKREAGGAAGARHGDLDAYWAGRLPLGQHLSQPNQGQIAAVTFGRVADLTRNVRRRRFHLKVGRPVRGAEGRQDSGNDKKDGPSAGGL